MSDGQPTSTDPESGEALSNSHTNETALDRQRNGGSSDQRKKECFDGSSGAREQEGGQKKFVVKDYYDKLRIVKRGAMLAAGLHSLTQFLGFSALTWATVVILGGYVSELSEHDFYSVSFLLLLEAIRLAVAVFFGTIPNLTRSFVHRSAVVTNYEHGEWKILVKVRNIQYASQLTVIAISVILPLRRLEDLGFSKEKSFDGLHDSLFIFYVLVLVNSTLAIVAVVHTKTITVLYLRSYDLRRYYDYIVWRGMANGLLYAHDFDFLTFAMKILADEYRLNLPTPAVYSLYKDLIELLYYDDKGFEVVCASLEAGDPYDREAAANMVGLWTQLDDDRSNDLGKVMLRLQTKLISRLAEAVGNEKTGRAAIISFEKLAKIDPEGLLNVKTQSGERLVDILINCIKGVVEVRKHNRALVYTKTLLHLLADKTCRNKIDLEQRRVLAEKLKEVFKGKCLKRTKAVAGTALRFLGQDGELSEGRDGELSNDDGSKYQLSEEEVMTELLLSQEPEWNEFMLEDEYQLLRKLINSEPKGVVTVRRLEIIYKPVFQRPATSFIAAIVILLAVICVAFLFLKFAPF